MIGMTDAVHPKMPQTLLAASFESAVTKSCACLRKCSPAFVFNFSGQRSARALPSSCRDVLSIPDTDVYRLSTGCGADGRRADLQCAHIRYEGQSIVITIRAPPL